MKRAAMAKLARCVGDIIRQAANGSVRHGVFVDRGDHSELRAIGDWLANHGDELTDIIS